MPVESMIKAVNVQTTMVSISGSIPAIIPSLAGSLVLTAACTIGDEPCPASLENIALFVPNINAVPTLPPINAPLASLVVKADTTMRRNISGISLKLTINT